MLDLLAKTRSFRRFDESRRIDYATLREIIGALRLCPSAANLQRIRVAPVYEEKECEAVFENIAFAAYLRPWVRPEVGERPVAYLVLMAEESSSFTLGIDVGIAAEAMLLVAREKGIGGCMFGSFTEDKLSAVLGREGYRPLLVIALGYPAETVVLEDVKDGNIRYYRDSADVHHVPKRTLDELII